MATWIVSGGGDALNNALNRRNGYAYTNGDTILVKPGTYSPVNFAQYFQNVSVIGEEGKENTIIDAGGMNGGNIVAISAGICNPCLLNRFSNSNYIFNFYGFSLRNGFISTDLSTDALIGSGIGYRAAGAHGPVRLYDCGIYDCSCYSRFNTGSANIGQNRIHAISRINGNLVRCEISGNHGNTKMVAMGNCYNCDIHDNYWEHANNGDRTMIGVNLYRSKFHHNYLSGVGFVSNILMGSLFYHNHGNESVWIGERCFAANCTFAYNTGIHSLDNGWGGRTYYKNCAFYQNFKSDTTRAGANWYTNNAGTEHINNYFDQLSTTMIYYTPMTSAYLSGNFWQNNADFGFVDPENDDYHLRPDSILISAGSTFQMGADNQYETNSSSRSQLSSLDNSLRSGDIERKPWDAEHPSVGAYQYQPPAQNIPNRMYPLGGRKVVKLPYDAEVEYVQNSDSNYLEGAILVEDIGGIAFDVEFASNGTVLQTFGSGQRPSSWGYNAQEDRILLVSTISGGAVSYAGLDTGFGRTLMEQYSAGARIVAPRISTSIEAYNSRLFGVFCAYNYRNARVNLTATVRLRSLTLWDHADGYLHDFIPVRVGTVGYLYDRANPTGGPSGNGLYGSETATPLVAGPNKTA